MMLNEPQSNSAMADKPGAVPVPAQQKGKRRMSLFSFGSNSPSNASKTQGLSAVSTSPGDNSLKNGKPTKPLAAQKLGPPSQLSSPLTSAPGEPNPLSEKPASHIFERSVQDMAAGQAKQEDFIPPALDATASILSDKHTDLDNVEMIYSSRRNSSVIGLNMALGRPCPPLRKNSTLALPIMASPNSSAALNSFNYAQAGNTQSSANVAQALSPVSPPKLVSSRSSVSFYSYADMINNDEFSRRPSLMHAYSHGGVSRKMSVTSNHSLASNGFNSGYKSGNETYKNQLEQIPQRTLKQKEADVLRFLISPESSDSEDHDNVSKFTDATADALIIKRKSFTSNHSIPDNESFVSTSVGDCIRQTNTEISGN